MAETPMPAVNGLDQIPPIKTEPVDPLLDPAEPPVVPKEFLESEESDYSEVSESEEMPYFTQVEVDNTRKCLENTRLIIKDFETQLDWHLQQYMLLRNPYNLKKNSKGPGRGGDDTKRQDLLSISQLSTIIANHPEGNKKFIKRSGPILEANGKKRRKNKDSDSEGDSDFSEDNSDEYDEEELEGHDSEDVDDPGVPKKKKPAKKVIIKRGKNKEIDPLVVPKEEIEEEIHELMVPKEEKPSDDEYDGGKVSQKSPSKKAKKTKLDVKSPNKKRVGAGKAKKNMETVDLTGMKTCQVFLNRLPNDPQDSIIEIKDEDIDRDELIELLQTKAINSLEKFTIDAEKPVAMLKADNLHEFDFNNCKTSNVIVTFEGSDNFPDFVFAKNIANYVLNGLIKLVQSNVLNQHLTGQKVNQL
jgi:hypothetical protein